MAQGATLNTLESNGVKAAPAAGGPLSLWWPLIWFGTLLGVSYAVVLARLGEQWLSDDDMSHGMFVPLLVTFIVWQRKDVLRALPAQSNLAGLFLMLAGGMMLCVGPPSLPTFVFLTRVGFIFSLVGLILFLRGAATIRHLIYPLFLLLFMIPLPGFLYQKLTMPLQFVASALSEHILEGLGYSVLREGNVLHLPGQTLNVVEACSGLRSLFSLSFLAQAYVYLFDSRPWMRGLMAVLIVPIAVLANACRIAASAMAGRINPDWGQGTVHEFTGWVVFVISFVSLLLVHQVVSRILKLVKEKRAQNGLS